MKERARAAVDDAFERGVGELFKVLLSAGSADQDAVARFSSGITKLVQARTKAMIAIDSFTFD